MKKRCFIPACVLAAAAVGFVMYVLGHPELSFPWSVRITHILYGLYVDVVILLFVLAFWKSDLPECSDAPVRAGRGIFPGAVHTYRHSGVGIQLVSASGTGPKLHRPFPERSPAKEKPEKRG